MATQQGTPINVSIKNYDNVPAEEYYGGSFEPLERGWALLRVADVITGASKDKGTPFAHFDLHVRQGRPSYFTKKGEGKHTFLDAYITDNERQVQFLRGLFEKALGLPACGGNYTTAYVRQAIGKEFVGRLDVEEDDTYGDKQRLQEMHQATPQWLAYVSEDRNRPATEKPKRGKRPGQGEGAAAAPSAPSGMPVGIA